MPNNLQTTAQNEVPQIIRHVTEVVNGFVLSKSTYSFEIIDVFITKLSELRSFFIIVDILVVLQNKQRQYYWTIDAIVHAGQCQCYGTWILKRTQQPQSMI